MTQAKNYVILFESGYEDQARKMVESQSIRVLQDWENESTVFVFADRSGIYMSGPEFREATTFEMTE